MYHNLWMIDIVKTIHHEHAFLLFLSAFKKMVTYEDNRIVNVTSINIHWIGIYSSKLQIESRSQEIGKEMVLLLVGLRLGFVLFCVKQICPYYALIQENMYLAVMTIQPVSNKTLYKVRKTLSSFELR